MLKYVFGYFVLISLFSVVACAIDKKNSILGSWRVPERNLMLLSVLGGSVAMYATMRIIHHKTRHNKFMIGIPAIIIVQLIILLAITYFLIK